MWAAAEKNLQSHPKGFSLRSCPRKDSGPARIAVASLLLASEPDEHPVRVSICLFYSHCKISACFCNVTAAMHIPLRRPSCASCQQGLSNPLLLATLPRICMKLVVLSAAAYTKILLLSAYPSHAALPSTCVTSSCCQCTGHSGTTLDSCMQRLKASCTTQEKKESFGASFGQVSLVSPTPRASDGEFSPFSLPSDRCEALSLDGLIPQGKRATLQRAKIFSTRSDRTISCE